MKKTWSRKSRVRLPIKPPAMGEKVARTPWGRGLKTGKDDIYLLWLYSYLVHVQIYKKAYLQICGTYLRTAHLWISLGRLQYGCLNICICRWVIVQEIIISMQYACNLFSSLCNLFSLFLSANTSFIAQHFEIFQLMKFLSCLAFSEVLIHFIHTIQFPFNAIFLGSFSAKWRNVNPNPS